MHTSAEKLLESATLVTGFGLFVLCHHFGQRGRAMARSFAGQIGCRVPIQLTVFYNRTRDADLVAEGAIQGPNPPRLTLIPVATEDILRRAMHFSQAHRMNPYSHTVFADADL